MANSYMPRKESEALAWMQVFAGGISANPALYMLLPADTTAISNTVDAFAAAYSVVMDEATNTRVTVRAKDYAFNSAQKICQQYYSLIKANTGIADTDKIAIGVRPVNRNRTPINCPQSSPLLNILSATPGIHTLRYHDTFTPTSSAKPFGATELQLFVTVDNDQQASTKGDPNDAKLVGKFTRNPISVDFTAKDGGKSATYYARWVSRRGETGPWSAPVTMHIAA